MCLYISINNLPVSGKPKYQVPCHLTFSCSTSFGMMIHDDPTEEFDRETGKALVLGRPFAPGPFQLFLGPTRKSLPMRSFLRLTGECGECGYDELRRIFFGVQWVQWLLCPLDWVWLRCCCCCCWNIHGLDIRIWWPENHSDPIAKKLEARGASLQDGGFFPPVLGVG